MTKWLQLSFAWKHITTFPSGKGKKIVQTGPLLFLKMQNPKYREPNTYWSVYFWGPANTSGMFRAVCTLLLVVGLDYLEREGDGDRYKDVQLQHRVSTVFFLYKGKSSGKTCSSPIFVITVCWEAGVRFETL